MLRPAPCSSTNSTAQAQRSWTEAHAQSVFSMCKQMDVPVDIGGFIERFVFTSAVAMPKRYPIANLNDIYHIGTIRADPLNIFVVGADKVGKSTLCGRDLRFPESNISHSTVDTDAIDGQLRRFHLMLHDHQLNGDWSAFKKAHAVVIVFDASRKKSFEWVEDSRLLVYLQFAMDPPPPLKAPSFDKRLELLKKLPIVLVANKIDTIDEKIKFGREFAEGKWREPSESAERVVPLNIIERVVSLYDIPYVEVSAECTVNVEQMLEMALQESIAFIRYRQAQNTQKVKDVCIQQ